MSVHELGDGRWAVRWRDGGRQRSRTCDSKSEAGVLDLRIQYAHRTGQQIDVPTLADLKKSTCPQASTPAMPTLEQYFVEPYGSTPSFYDRRQVQLAKKTRDLEADFWDRCIGPTLGQVPIDEIQTVVVEDWRDDLLHCSGVGVTSVERAQKVVSKVLNDAARRGVIPFNPAAGASFEKGTKKPIRPLEPMEIERIALQLEVEDAFMVRFLGCTGLRPGELVGTGESIGVRWRDLRTDASGSMTLCVYAGKTRVLREVRILEPLREDLVARKNLSKASDEDLVLPGPDGLAWNDHRYRNWRYRHWKAACQAAGVGERRPYDLRHGFGSLLLHEGRSLTYVARQLGNDPRVLANTYAHVLDGLSDSTAKVTAEEAIRQARATVQVQNVR